MEWNGVSSDYFSVRNGVKQGGVISPVFFYVYADSLLKLLSDAKVGCYIGGRPSSVNDRFGIRLWSVRY